MRKKSQGVEGGRRRALLARFALALAAAWLAGEAAVRLFGGAGAASPEALRARSLQFEPAVYARHALPQMVQRIETDWGTCYVNSRGYRGPEFAVPKPSGVTRIVVIGGSQVYDGLTPDGSEWPRLAERVLRESGCPEAQVINAGVPGHASADTLGRLYAEIWMFEPDVVVVCHAWNDIKYFAELSLERSLLRCVRPPPFRRVEGRDRVWNPYLYPAGEWDRRLCRSQLYVCLRSRWLSLGLGQIGFEGLIRGRKGNGGTPPALAEGYGDAGPRQYELNLCLIVEAIRGMGALPVLLTQPRLVAAENTPAERARIRCEYAGLTHAAVLRAFEDCEAAVRRVAEAKQVALLDFAARFSGRGELFRDQVHTTLEGSYVLGNALGEGLLPLVRERAAAEGRRTADDADGGR